MMRFGRKGILSLLFIFPLTASSYYVDQSSLLKIPINFYASLYFSLCVASSAVYTVNINLRLNAVADILRLRVKRRRILYVKPFDGPKTEEVYNTLAEIYSDLSDNCDGANICFGFQMMLAFGLIFFYTLFTVFTAYTDLEDKKRLTGVTIVSGSFCIYYIMFLNLVIYTCNKAEKKVKKVFVFQFKISIFYVLRPIKFCVLSRNF